MQSQLDFINDFEAADRERAVADRQRQATHDIIDQSPADRRVKALLHVLADLPRMKDEMGNWLVTASIQSTLVSRLARTRNCVRSYIKLALASRFLGMLDDCDDDDRTYVIYWRRILDRETQPDATSTASRQDTDSPDATSTVDTGSWGSESVEGVDFDPGQMTHGVDFDPGQMTHGVDFDPGQMPSSEERLKDVSKAQVKSTSPDVLNVLDAPEGGQSRKSAKPMKLKFWKQWEDAVRVSELGKAQHVQQLYEMITSMCVLKRCDANRLRVFAAAAMNERMVKSGEAQTRKGLFLTNTARQMWFHNHFDELIATRMIHDIDHPSGPSIESRVAAAPRVIREHRPPDQAAGAKTNSLVSELADAWGVAKKTKTSADSPNG